MKRTLSLLVICALLCTATACSKAKTANSTTTASAATTETVVLETQSTTTATTVGQPDEFGTDTAVSTTGTTAVKSTVAKTTKTTVKKTTVASTQTTSKKTVSTTAAKSGVATTATTTKQTTKTTTTTTAKPTTTTTKIPTRVYQTDTFRIEVPTYLDGEYKAWVDNTSQYFLQSVEAEYGYVYFNLSFIDENDNWVNKRYYDEDFIIYIRHSENSWGKDTVETYSPEALEYSMAKGIVFSMKDGLSAVVGCEYEENGNLGGFSDSSTCTVDWPKELEYIISTFEWL